MARNFEEADLILWVDGKILGGKTANGTQQGFEISDSDWTNTVLPAINGTWHVVGLDELTCLHYWLENNPTGTDAWYLAEIKDLRGEVVSTYNDSAKLDEAAALYNTLKPLHTTYKNNYDADQQAKLDAENQRKYFLDNNIPENMEALRAARSKMLADTDWIMLDDVWEAAAGMALANVPAAAKVKDNWKTYRQRLRDFPSVQADPYDYNNFVQWPVNPADPSFVP
tara:strand:+ start:8061 stop:8738 length:678 start_codon:yes stop_codon:yes gene_type:complete